MTPKQTKITFFKSIQELSTTMHSVFVPAPQSHLTRLAVFLASSTMLSPFTVHNANRRWSGRSKLLIACTWAGSEGAKFDQGVQDTADLQSRNSLRSAGKHEKASVLAESKRCDSSRHDATCLTSVVVGGQGTMKCLCMEREQVIPNCQTVQKEISAFLLIQFRDAIRRDNQRNLSHQLQ